MCWNILRHAEPVDLFDNEVKSTIDYLSACGVSPKLKPIFAFNRARRRLPSLIIIANDINWRVLSNANPGIYSTVI